MQKKILFLSKNLHNSKKSSTFAPAFEKKTQRGPQRNLFRRGEAEARVVCRLSEAVSTIATSKPNAEKVSLAQLVEQLTLNQRVEGSSPSGDTKRKTSRNFGSFFYPLNCSAASCSAASCSAASCSAASCSVASCSVASCSAASCSVASCSVASCSVASCSAASCSVASCSVASCSVASCSAASCSAAFCSAASCSAASSKLSLPMAGILAMQKANKTLGDIGYHHMACVARREFSNKLRVTRTGSEGIEFA